VLSLENALAWMATTPNPASTQYIVGIDGRTGMAVEERDRTVASSSGVNDNAAVTIEVVNSAAGGDWPVSQTAYNAMIRLCVDICRRNPGIRQANGKPGLTYDKTKNGSLTQHRMFSNTICPGNYLLSRFPQICDEVNRQLAGSTGNPRPILRRGAGMLPNAPLNDVRDLQRLLNTNGASPKLTIDGRFGSQTETAVRAYQRRVGIGVDGIVGPVTWGRLLPA